MQSVVYAYASYDFYSQGYLKNLAKGGYLDVF